MKNVIMVDNELIYIIGNPKGNRRGKVQNDCPIIKELGDAFQKGLFAWLIKSIVEIYFYY